MNSRTGSGGFSFSYTVPVGDINYGGHMGNDKYLALFHEARVSFLESIGLSEADIGGGIGMIMSAAYVAFKGEIFLHHRLTIRVWVSEMKDIKFTFEYRIFREKDGAEVAAGYTKMAAFDYKARRPARVPESFKKAAGL